MNNKVDCHAKGERKLGDAVVATFLIVEGSTKTCDPSFIVQIAQPILIRNTHPYSIRNQSRDNHRFRYR